MVHAWPEKFGKAFLNDLFFWVWQRINTNTTEIWDAREAKTAAAPWQTMYSHEVNTAIRAEFRTKTWIPEDKYFNILVALNPHVGFLPRVVIDHSGVPDMGNPLLTTRPQIYLVLS